MRRNLIATGCVAAILTLAAVAAPAQREASGGRQVKRILLELFTSQGCNMCPAAEDLIARLPELGIDPQRVVPLGFHVDYFNEPWKDPFSDPKFSAREWQYSILYDRANKVGKRDYLYFTPMLMVDGRYPMLGSDREKARKAIRKALSGRPGVHITLAVMNGEDARRKSLEVELTQPSAEVAGRDVLVGAAIYEDPATTAVASGENGGKSLTEHYVVRRLDVRPTRVPRNGPTTVTFPVELGDGWVAERIGLAAYVQDETTGRIHQAASIPWPRTGAEATVGR